MLSSLINLRALVLLAQFDLDLSVRSARKLAIVFAGLVLAACFILAPHLHLLGGPGFILVGDEKVDRLVTTFAVLWIALGVGTYAKTRTRIFAEEKNNLNQEEFGLRALLGCNVLTTAIVDRLASLVFLVIALTILSVGVIVNASWASYGLFFIGSGLGFSLCAQAAYETLSHLVCPRQRIRYFSIPRMLVPSCLVLVFITLIHGWQTIGSNVRVSEETIIILCCVAAVLVVVTLTRLLKSIHSFGYRPLGLPVTRSVKGITTINNARFSRGLMSMITLFMCQPLLMGLMATRWTVALTLMFSVTNTSIIRENLTWFTAFALISTLESFSLQPDLLMSGRVLRFYYEERGRLSKIFAISILSRAIAILPQSAVMLILCHITGGSYLYTIILVGLSVASDVFGNSFAGSSHYSASPYRIATAGLVAFLVTAIGTAFLWISSLATIALICGTLIFAYFAWRKNVSYIT